MDSMASLVSFLPLMFAHPLYQTCPQDVQFIIQDSPLDDVLHGHFVFTDYLGRFEDSPLLTRMSSASTLMILVSLIGFFLDDLCVFVIGIASDVKDCVRERRAH